MSRRIIQRAPARRDLDEQAAFIGKNSPRNAIRFLQSACDCFELLAEMPLLGPRRDIRNPKLQGLRMWRVRGFEKHLIFYRPLDDGIEIIRILHGARDVQTILETDDPDPGA